jgi:hypothetical protein
MRQGTDMQALFDKYGHRDDVQDFKVHHRGSFFARQISPEALALLRCEPDVQALEYNAVITTDI